MIYRVSHLTEYRYSDAVTTSHHELHLLPRRSEFQSGGWEELSVSPEPTVRHNRLDYFGNRTTYVEIHEPHRRLAVLARTEVEVLPTSAPLPAIAPPWEVARELFVQPRAADLLEAAEFTFSSPYVRIPAGIAAYASASFTPNRSLVEAALDLMRRIHTDFIYDNKATNVSTPVEDVLALRRGVCQDFAHLMLACLRSQRLAARYVSGYLVTAPPPGQPRMVGADASHAWVSVFCPGFGWLDLDPTNDVVPAEKHVTLAYGRDFGDVTPLRGVILGGGPHELKVAVDVVPVAEQNGDG